jgi:P27 family predicted phage terminase small subunit
VVVFGGFWLLGVRNVARTKKSELREQIKQDLTDQLERQGVYGRHYLDLVEDYMALWDTKNALISDIKKRGVMIKYQNGENQWGYKKNDSVGNLVKVNKQMLELLRELGLRAADFEADSDDDEEM